MQIDEEQEIAIEDFFELSKEGGTYNISTPYGWQEIGSLINKKNRECLTLVLENGLELGCSCEHLVWTSNEIRNPLSYKWKKAEDINVQIDSIFVEPDNAGVSDEKFPWQKVVAKEHVGVRDTFDLEVRHQYHCYYSNNILSHNCGKSMACDAVANAYKMPLLRLDFGAIFKSHVGESENNIRQCLAMAEAIAPCVCGDSEIHVKFSLSDGIWLKVEQMSIKRLWEVCACLVESIVSNDEEQLTFKYPLQILGYDSTIGSPKWIKLHALVKRVARRCLRIFTDEGSIEVTENHQFLVEELNGSKSWEKAKDLQENDSIINANSNNIQTVVSEDNTNGGEKMQETVSSCKLQKITSIEVINKECDVYDPCCSDPYAYIANGFVNHNCILWIDEVEKGIGGVESSNSTDGGVTSRVFGTLLTWMQDKTAPVFVACTANNILGIPAEFMRAGRFDEIFFIDLPGEDQRHEVTEKLLSRKGRVVSDFDIDEIVSASKNYTPVEIEKGINNALFVAYSDNKRSLATKDIVGELKKFFPLYNSRREEVDAMRVWALGLEHKGGRAILANSPVKPIVSTLVSDDSLDL